MTDINQLSPWPLLKAHHQKLAATPLSGLFAQDAGRFDKLSMRLPGVLADYSKNHITEETISLLVSLARAAGLEKRRDAMFAGDKINLTENRAVLHTALRAAPDAQISVDGGNIVPAVHETLARMGAFSEAVRSGAWKGHSGKEITDIVNIGIGGSSLGPQLACEALAAFHHPRLRAHYVANVEASDLGGTLRRADPETTLLIVASKTFTTAETMQNAHIARDWLLAHYKGDAASVAKHFVAASTNAAAVEAFGIAPENMFPFQDWVGGRYSVWSSIGLSVMLMTGADKFADFLLGARDMDAHFKTAPLEKNLPVLLALIGLWHRNLCNYPALAVIPYHAALRRLSAFLQQLDMESNGKRVMQDGKPVPVATGPIIFGEPGTDAQHSFFQWLHQSPDIAPVDFIVCAKPSEGTEAQHNMLLANCLAQSAALMAGQNNPAEPHRHFTGNRPSTTFILDALTPYTLGLLLAMYEHKVFVQGVLWCVNSFDQWGVELGKALAKDLEPEIAGTAPPSTSRDASTAGLVAHIQTLKA
jgi:glucose-6-phosphate isomerase